MKDVKSRFALLSVGAALATLMLKFTAYLLTGSVGILSDALESLVNLAGALIALTALKIAAKPADKTHPYGHDKAEYFSSGAEGTLILIAAGSIAYAAIERLIRPIPLEQLNWGLIVAGSASLLNFIVARALLSAANRYDSITLEADAKHLLTDVWTSVGVIAGLLALAVTGWQWLDSLIALAVAGHIVLTGVNLVRRSIDGLMDYSLPSDELIQLEAVLNRHRDQFVAYHRLRARKSGSRRFVDLHLVVPGARSVQEAHDLCERVERDIEKVLPHASVTIHIEPAEDEASYDDDLRDSAT
ncbi:MAG: cation diffusion facilitator family transporter [Candidatus Bipolaricaulota bacterium]|nr:cation diffusion facilitator family transporter [Candidatus Bipolaricaulota bacterium]MCS7274969.1 cation diffusion facilitator family transporter [Candidatus Bipolaricaulota bacterium]MDW8110344.1 cation diffusion facilitator family transporter [Candidatus Bipolaricaulota bacterium]MDW8328760.1 cation diffusion facilitator family transporter [Candidatus Bipolaricaulota bacterium]